MVEQAERRARMGLAALGVPNDGELAEWLGRLGAAETWQRLLVDPAHTLAASRARRIDLDELDGETGYVGSRFVIPGDPEWSAALDELVGHELHGTRGVPFGLWVLGLGLNPQRPVALTGARAATTYGVTVAEQMAGDLAVLGHAVVTSLAYGVDVAAIQGSITAEGMAPVVVLASGLMHMRLSSHEHLVAELPERATIVTEHAPSVVPSRASFLARCRLMAALSEGTVVVEAAMRSGSRTTATWSEMLGKPVMAVPGPITSSQSRMPHRLIQQGAHLVECAEDIAAVLDRASSTTNLVPAEGIPS